MVRTVLCPSSSRRHADLPGCTDTKLYFNLTTHTSLKTLHLSLTDDITGPHLLSQIAYIRPMRIILTDSRYNIENLLKAGEHVVFDDLLSGATFRHLPEILFVYRGVREPRKEMIKKLFPKLCADDRLRILWSKGPTVGYSLALYHLHLVIGAPTRISVVCYRKSIYLGSRIGK